MLAWSPGTPKGAPVTAEVIVLPKFADSTEFVKWLPKAKGKIVLLSPALPTCRPSEDWARWATPESMARMDTTIALVNREYAVMTDATGRPDSTKLYRGTGYSLALGTGTPRQDGGLRDPEVREGVPGLYSTLAGVLRGSPRSRRSQPERQQHDSLAQCHSTSRCSEARSRASSSEAPKAHRRARAPAAQ